MDIQVADFARRMDMQPDEVCRLAYVHSVPIWFRLVDTPIMTYDLLNWPAPPAPQLAPLPWPPGLTFTGWASISQFQPDNLPIGREIAGNAVVVAANKLALVHRLGRVERDPDSPDQPRAPTWIEDAGPDDFGIVDPARKHGRGVALVRVGDLYLAKPGALRLVAQAGLPAELLDGPPAGLKLPAGVDWPDLAALAESDAPPELVEALQVWARLRQWTGRTLPANPPKLPPRGQGPHWLGDLVGEVLPGASQDKRQRLATLLNRRKRGGALSTGR